MVLVRLRAVAFASALLSVLASARPVTALPAIQRGSDYMQTRLGSFFDFPGIGPVGFIGHPPSQCLPPSPCVPGADTLIRRLEHAEFADGSVRIPTQLVQLSLMSVDPVMVGDSFFDVFVDVSQNKPSLGHLDIHLQQPPEPDMPAGGTYESFFDIFVDLNFVPAVQSPVAAVAGSQMLDVPLGEMMAHGNWSSQIPPGIWPVLGAADDPFANWHPGRDQDQFDFFPLGAIIHSNESGQHVGRLARVPEPGTLTALALGLAGLVRRRRRGG